MAEVSVDVLAELPNKEYNEVLWRSLHPNRFGPFLDARLVRRTQKALSSAETSIYKQIANAQQRGAADAEWVERANKKAEQFRRYLGIVEGAIRHYPTIREDKKEAKKWRKFAEQVTDTVLGTEYEAILHDIDTPFGGLSAFEWAMRRKEKKK